MPTPRRRRRLRKWMGVWLRLRSTCVWGKRSAQEIFESKNCWMSRNDRYFRVEKPTPQYDRSVHNLSDLKAADQCCSKTSIDVFEALGLGNVRSWKQGTTLHFVYNTPSCCCCCCRHWKRMIHRSQNSFGTVGAATRPIGHFATLVSKLDVWRFGTA